MTTPSIDPALLAKLADPSVAAMLKEILFSDEEKEVKFAPFYMNKHGKITKGHKELELQRANLDLTPVYHDEAVKLGLIDENEVPKIDNNSEQKDLNNPGDEELKLLRTRAKELDIANWHVKGAARLQGEIKKAEMKIAADAENSEDGEE